MKATWERGFTLLEVVLAVTLLGVVMAVVFACYQVAGDSFVQAGRLTAASGRVRVAYRILSNDLAAAYWSPYDPRLSFDGRSDRLALTVRGGPGGFRQVWLGPDLAGEALERIVVSDGLRQMDAFVRPEGTSEALLPGRAGFRYLDGRTGGWTTSWRSDVEERLPAAVELTIEAALPPLIVPVGAGRAYTGGDVR